MLRILFLVILILHGLIHFMGFGKAFGYGNFTQLTKDVSKPAGMLWLFAACCFLVTAILFLLRKDAWWVVGAIAAVLSQILIVSAWNDARYGIIANVVVLVVCALAFTSWRFEKAYRRDVAGSLANIPGDQSLITEADLQALPQPVQRYLRYTGVVGKPKITAYRIVFEGQMRDKGKDWFRFTSEQYNFTGVPTRLFFMKAKMFGLNVPGYHDYKNGQAGMHIKLFGLLPMVNKSGGVLDKAETVTIFNDMCIFAPGSLVDNRIRWQAINDSTAGATFSVNGNTISAELQFNSKGELVNFISDDRYAVADMQQYRFSTPVSAYKNFGGYRLAGYGEAVWHYPDGQFVYGKFETKSVEYNVRQP